MQQRPFVSVLVAASLDGRISLGPNRTMWDDMADPRNSLPGDQQVWAEVRRQLHELHRPELSLLGSNSLKRAGDALAALPPYSGDSQLLFADYLPAEVVQATDRQGWLAVVDGQGRCRSGYRGEDGHYMLHLVAHGVAPEYLAFLQQQRIPYLVNGEKRVDLRRAFAKLHHLLGVTSLTTEAGGNLAGALLRAGLVDEVNLIVRPMIIGGFHTPALFDSPELTDEQPPARLQLLAAEKLDNDHLWLRYLVLGDSLPEDAAGR